MIFFVSCRLCILRIRQHAGSRFHRKFTYMNKSEVRTLALCCTFGGFVYFVQQKKTSLVQPDPQQSHAIQSNLNPWSSYRRIHTCVRFDSSLVRFMFAARAIVIGVCLRLHGCAHVGKAVDILFARLPVAVVVFARLVGGEGGWKRRGVVHRGDVCVRVGSALLGNGVID